MNSILRSLPHWRVFLVTVLTAGLSLYAVSLLLDNTQIFSSLESNVSDRLIAAVPPLPPDPNILIAAVNSETPKLLGPDRNSDGPLDRRVYAKLFTGLRTANASVVLSDIIFAADVLDEDPLLHASLAKGAVPSGTQFVLPMDAVDEAESDTEPDGFAYTFRIGAAVRDTFPGVYKGFSLPFAPDGVVSGCVAQKIDRMSRQPFWNCALLAAWCHLHLDPAQARIDGTSLELPPWEAELGGNSDFQLEWTPEKVGFPIVPLQTVLADLDQGRSGKYEGKLIIVADLRNEDDSMPVPYHGRVPGPLILANLVNSALTSASHRIHRLSFNGEMTYSFLLALMAGLAVRSGRRGWMLFGLGTPLLGAVGLALAAALTMRLTLPVVLPLGAGLLTAVLVLLRLSWFAGPTDLRRAGELTEATVLFSDLEDSTGWVQRLGAQEYQRRYGKWVASCDRVIRRHGGSVERTTGDGFIAVFPQPGSVSTFACLEAVQECLAFDSELKAFFGFEFGPVSGGYVKESGRQVWSSSGTTVNLAKRLQSLAADEGHRVVFGPIAARYLTERLQVSDLGTKELKGLEQSVHAHTTGFKT